MIDCLVNLYPFETQTVLKQKLESCGDKLISMNTLMRTLSVNYMLQDIWYEHFIALFFQTLWISSPLDMNILLLDCAI